MYGKEEKWFSILSRVLYKEKKKVIWEVETGRLGIQDHSPLPWEFENSMGYLSLRLKKKKREKEGRRQKEEER